MKSEKIIVFLAVLLFSTISMPLYSQTGQLWLTYNLQARVSKDWSMMADANHRFESFKEFDAVVSALRVGAMYHLTERKHAAGGYAWFTTHVAGRSGALLHEHRLWQQYQVAHTKTYGTILHRFRLEQRLREFSVDERDKHNFSVRGRYMASFLHPLIAKRKGRPGLTLQLADEIMVHEGEGIRSFFDQNRLIAGFQVVASPSLSVATLYQLTHQYQPVRDVINPIHVIRLTLIHTPNFRHAEKGPDVGQ